MVDLSFDFMHLTTDDSATENGPDSVRQWLQLIRDENSLLSQDFLSASDTYSCPDSSTVSQNTMRTQDGVESVITADHSKDLPQEDHDTATENKNLTASLGDDMCNFALTHSVYQEIPLGIIYNISIVDM